MSARASSFGDPDLYVCMTPSRAYDIDENRVLVSALVAVRDAARFAIENTPTRHQEDATLRMVKRNGNDAGRFVEHPSLQAVSRERPKARALKRTRSGKKKRTYEPAIDMLRREANPLTPEDVRAWCDKRTLLQHHVLMGIIHRLEARGARLPPFRTERGALYSGPVQYYHARLLGERGRAVGDRHRLAPDRRARSTHRSEPQPGRDRAQGPGRWAPQHGDHGRVRPRPGGRQGPRARPRQGLTRPPCPPPSSTSTPPRPRSHRCWRRSEPSCRCPTRSRPRSSPLPRRPPAPAAPAAPGARRRPRTPVTSSWSPSTPRAAATSTRRTSASAGRRRLPGPLRHRRRRRVRRARRCARSRGARARGHPLPAGSAHVAPPEVLSQGAASLLPDQDRPAVLWSIDLDADGDAHRSVPLRAGPGPQPPGAQLPGGAGRARRGRAPTSRWSLLREVGRLREAREAERGGVSLPPPGPGGRCSPPTAVRRSCYEAPLPVEGWNAQISLLTGIVGGRHHARGPHRAAAHAAPARRRGPRRPPAPRRGAALDVADGRRATRTSCARSIRPAGRRRAPAPGGPDAAGRRLHRRSTASCRADPRTPPSPPRTPT